MVDPLVADRIRKTVAFTFAVVETVLLFRVLARLARGSQRLGDIELWIVVVLGALAMWWVAHAKHVRRAAPEAPEEEKEGDA